MDAKLHPQEHQPGHVELGEGAGEVRGAYASRDRLGVAVGLRQSESQRVWRVYDEAIYALGLEIYRRYQQRASARTQRLQATAAGSCAYCGAKATVLDHRDYGKPDETVPCCAECNVNLPPAVLSADVVWSHITRREAFYSETFEALAPMYDQEFREGLRELGRRGGLKKAERSKQALVSEMARRAGSTKSPKRAAASRRNGKLGGRPAVKKAR